jgi:hypothetical protein
MPLTKETRDGAIGSFVGLVMFVLGICPEVTEEGIVSFPAGFMFFLTFFYGIPISILFGLLVETISEKLRYG